MITHSSSSSPRIRSSKSWRTRKLKLMRRSAASPPYVTLRKSFKERPTNTDQSSKVPVMDPDACPHCGAKNSFEFDSESATCVECAIRLPDMQNFIVPKEYSNRNSGRSLIRKHLYERLVYFKQIINDVRGERTGCIPSTVETKLKERLEGIPHIFITPHFVTLTLKRMRLSKYNCHRVDIARRYSGGLYKPAFVLHRHWRVFLYLFRRIEQVYPAVRKRVAPKRKIFFNYSYLFARFCQLVDRPDYCSAVPRLGSAYARVIQGRLWRAVCARINLPWHPTPP